MKTWVVRPVQGAHEQLWMGHADDAIEAVKMAWARGVVPMRPGEFVCVDHDANVFYVEATDRKQQVVDVEFAGY